MLGDVIKSYLVSLGFSVDKNSYNEATRAMGDAEKSVAKFAGGAVKEFAVAGAAVTTFVATASIGIAKFLGDLAQADLSNEKLARQLWTTKDNAAAFSSTLKAMGVELQDLYLSPELMRNFQLLREQAHDMRPPAEFSDQMKLVRSIQYEFTRMKLEATYALQWIGYYLVKYMGGPLTQIKLTLKDINDTIIKTMPHWTKVVAEVMSWFARMGDASVRAIKDIARVFNDVGEAIPRNIKLIGGAILGLGLILKTGPVGILITAFTSLLLLLDDFYTYLDGGQSKFSSFWKKVVDLYDGLKDSGAIEAFKKNLKDAFETISNAVEAARKWLVGFYTDLENNGSIENFKVTASNVLKLIGDLFQGDIDLIQKMYSELDKQGAFSELARSITDVTQAIANLTAALSEALRKFTELGGVKDIFSTIGDFMDKYVLQKFQQLDAFLKAIKEDFNAVASLLKGDFGEAGKGLLKTMGNLLQLGSGIPINDIISKLYGNNSPLIGPPAPTYMYPQSNVQNNSSNKVSLSPTYNIYGSSDPKATADAANDYNWALMRSAKSWGG